MVFSHAEAFAGFVGRFSGSSFGTPSYYQAGKDCPIGGSWESYCDCMFEPGSNENHLCKSKYCVVFNPFSPGDCSADPRKAAPPWTEVGAAARSIRKPNAGAIYGITSVTNLPGPDSYDPEKLVVIGATDPIKFEFLAGVATYVSATFGAAYMAQFRFPLSVASGLPIAVGLAISRGGPNRAWTNVLEPMLNSSAAQAIMDYALGGPPAVAARAMEHIAKNLPVGIPKAVILAIANAAPTVIDAVRHPDKFRESYVYSAIGVGMQQIAKALDPNSPRGVFVLVGEALDTFARTISALLKGKPDLAIDEASFAVFGVKWSTLKNLGSTDKAKILAAADGSALDGLATVGNVITDIANALAQIQLSGAASAVNDIGAALGQILDTIKGTPGLGAGAATHPAVTTPTTPAQVQATNLQAGASAWLSLVASGPVMPMPSKSAGEGPSVAPSATKRALVGAAGGFFVAGPPGALVGAGIGALSVALASAFSSYRNGA